MILLIVVLITSLTGCSGNSKGTIIIRDDKIVLNNKELPEDITFSGDHATGIAYDGSSTVKYSKEQSFDYCDNNRAGVYLEDTDKYKKDAFGFSMYMGSTVTMHYTKNKGYDICCSVNANSAGTSFEQNVIFGQMYETAKLLDFNTEYKTISIEDVMDINVIDLEFSINKSNITVSTLFTVMKSNTSLKGTSTINDISVSYDTDGNYDYYGYRGFVIKAQKGVAIGSWITLKS